MEIYIRDGVKKFKNWNAIEVWNTLKMDMEKGPE